MWCCSKPIAIEPTLKLFDVSPADIKLDAKIADACEDVRAVVAQTVEQAVAQSVEQALSVPVVEASVASVENVTALLDPTSTEVHKPTGSRPTDALRFAPPLEILEALMKYNERREFVRTFLRDKFKKQSKPKAPLVCETAEPAEPVPAEPVPAEPVPAEPVPAEPTDISSLALRAAEETRVQDSVDDALTCESGEVSDSESSGCDWFKALSEQD